MARRPPHGTGGAAATVPPFDALVEGLARAVGAAQARLAARSAAEPAPDHDAAEAPGFTVELPATNAEPALRLRLGPSAGRRRWRLRRVEFGLDAGVEAVRGVDAPAFDLVFAQPPRGPARRVHVEIAFDGLQPGRGEVRIDGELLRRWPADDAAGELG